MTPVSIRARKTSEGGFTVDFFFLGTLWHLKTAPPKTTNKYWLIRAESDCIWHPLIHHRDGYRMNAGDNNVIGAVASAKFQILRLKYKKIVPTFNEQYTRYFTSPFSVVAKDACVGT